MSETTNLERLNQLIEWVDTGKRPNVPCAIADAESDEGGRILSQVIAKEFLIIHVERVRSIRDELAGGPSDTDEHGQWAYGVAADQTRKVLELVAQLAALQSQLDQERREKEEAQELCDLLRRDWHPHKPGVWIVTHPDEHTVSSEWIADSLAALTP
jgi:hypothetical protein